MLIQSASNSQIKYIRALSQNRKARKAHREFFVEGVQAIYEAYRNGWDVRKLIYCPTMVQSNWAKKTLAESDSQTHIQITEFLHNKLSERSDHELLAIVSQPDDDLARIPIRPELLVVLLEHPQNPGNLGTIIRSCDAMGVHGVLIIEPAVDLYDPKTVRATMGSLFAIPSIRVKTLHILQEWIDKVLIKSPNLQIVGTSPYASTTIDRHDFTLPTILVVGNEQSGMSDQIKMMCDALVSIPMSGSADSLNIAVATSIMLYEINRQRFSLKIAYDCL